MERPYAKRNAVSVELTIALETRCWGMHEIRKAPARRRNRTGSGDHDSLPRRLNRALTVALLQRKQRIAREVRRKAVRANGNARDSRRRARASRAEMTWFASRSWRDALVQGRKRRNARSQRREASLVKPSAKGDLRKAATFRVQMKLHPLEGRDVDRYRERKCTRRV